MRGALSQLLDKLKLRQRAYQQTFGAPGTPAHDAFVDLARFCHAFHNEVSYGDHDTTLVMAGRRQAFFHIWEHLHIDPSELIHLYPKIRMGDEA